MPGAFGSDSPLCVHRGLLGTYAIPTAERETVNRLARPTVILGAAILLGGCGETPFTNLSGEELCSLNPDLLTANLPPDAIPALTEPEMVAPNASGAQYLFDFDRVLGVVIDGEARAYPHNVLWHHEIVNDRINDTWITVTFCPLTGSGLAFSPFVDGIQLDLGVSGLLFANNLVMFDRVGGAVYGPQLSVEGKCATFRDKSLSLMPVQEMSWGRWKELYPDTKVVSDETGWGLDYRTYPYGSYAQLFNNELLVPMDVDDSRPLKERVLVIRLDDTDGRGYPFGELAGMGDAVAVNELVGPVPTVVFYEVADGEVAIAFDARVDDRTLTFEAAGDGLWRDVETGSAWTIDGVATSGPLAGARLSTREDAFVVFWFAWRHFLPDGDTFTG